MTERGRSDLTLGPSGYGLGRSRLMRRGDSVVAEVDEISTPLMRPVRGRIVIHPTILGDASFDIDGAGRHRWTPLAPSARIEVDFPEPGLRWSGRGYFDMNEGAAPLEDDFRFWDWSRAELPDGGAAILYNTDCYDGARRTLALRTRPEGGLEPFEPPPPARLPPTPIWRIQRRTRAEDGAARVVRSLEDTPFYSRSVIETRLFGRPARAVHESLVGDRLRSSWVHGLLPYRMPRDRWSSAGAARVIRALRLGEAQALRRSTAEPAE